MSTKEALARAQQKYKKKIIKRIALDLHKVNDADIIEKLDTVTSKQGYIKESIREKMHKEDKDD